MPKKSEGGSKKKRAPSLRQKLVRDLVSERKSLRAKLRQVERDLRSIRGKSAK